MQPTRQKIISHLESHPSISSQDLGRYLQMTSANIRYHLGVLEKEGVIQVSGQRPAGGAGRPILLYNLTSQTLGENLIPLLQAILSGIGKNENSDQELKHVVEGMTKEYRDISKNRITRFNQAVMYLNQLYYHASWEVSPQGPQVELRHCPYRDLAIQHSLLCQMDEQILTRLFQVPLILTQKRTFGKNPFSPCVFQVAAE